MSVIQEFVQQCSALEQSTEVTRWVIALSGGLDSMVTLELAHRYLANSKLVALHVNHQQQSSAAHWQRFCAEQCQSRNITYQSITVSPQGGSEQLLRDARYQCFESFLVEGDCLLLGHHANDQAETILFRLVRGAGAKGLSAIPRQRNIAAAQLMRPLLGLSRAALEAFADQQKLAWVDDPSNNSLDYDRNYIRHKVLAPLREHWPKASVQMAISAQLLSDDHRLLNQYLAADLKVLVTNNCLDLVLFKAIEPTKAMALLRYWLVSETGVGLGKKLLQRIVEEVINSRADSLACCPVGTFQCRRFKTRLFLLPEQPVVDAWPTIDNTRFRYSLSHGLFTLQQAGSGIELLEGMYLQSKEDGMTVTAVNRPRKKLKKLFQEHGVPPWLRESWPLLMYRGELVAIPGICICEGWLQHRENKSLFWPQWQAL